MRDIQGGKEEEGWLRNAHEIGKRDGIIRQEWVLIVIYNTHMHGKWIIC